MYGMPIIIDPACDNVPRMTCSPEFCRVLPGLVESSNAWMLEFFGTHDISYILDDPLTGQSLVMGPRTWARLPKEHTKREPWEW